MKILIVLFCLFTCHLFAQEQEFSQILASRNIELKDFSSMLSENDLAAPIIKASPSCLALMPVDLDKKLSVFYETQSVYVQKVGVFHFHIADYIDGTKVVTCLDGELKGLQGIAVNGVKIVESNNVEWKQNYFIHKYPSGNVYSYSNKQIVEIL